MSKRRGVLLVDLGTPEEPTEVAVREYLEQFLSDPYVVRGPAWIREVVFRRMILPWRIQETLKSYQRIWTPEGAPLRVQAKKLSSALEVQLQKKFGTADFNNIDWKVRFGFHYGQPSLKSALDQFAQEGVEELIIVPLYPQWALGTRGALEERLKTLNVYRTRDEGGYGFSKVVVTPIFYDQAFFIATETQLLRETLQKEKGEDVAVIFSFHGLPESHIRAVVPSCKKCLRREGECRPLPWSKSHCYRSQCYETATRIAVNNGLFNWDVAFQSRRGLSRWLEPRLLDVIDHLVEEGAKTLVVQCPSYVFDCLESLDEVGRQAREYFLKRGGQNFILVPALNDKTPWIEGLADWMIIQSGLLGPR